MYDRGLGTTAVQQIFDEYVYIQDGSIMWEEIAALYEPLPIVLLAIIRGLLCPDRQSHGLAMGWGWVIECMVTDGTRYAWGPCVLSHLYRELHEVVYQETSSLGVGITLLHI